MRIKNVSKYRDAYKALCKLNADFKRSGLRPLMEEDLNIKGVDRLHTLGSGSWTETNGWIDRANKPGQVEGENTDTDAAEVQAWDDEGVFSVRLRHVRPT